MTKCACPMCERVSELRGCLGAILKMLEAVPAGNRFWIGPEMVQKLRHQIAMILFDE